MSEGPVPPEPLCAARRVGSSSVGFRQAGRHLQRVSLCSGVKVPLGPMYRRADPCGLQHPEREHAPIRSGTRGKMKILIKTPAGKKVALSVESFDTVDVQDSGGHPIRSAPAPFRGQAVGERAGPCGPHQSHHSEAEHNPLGSPSSRRMMTPCITNRWSLACRSPSGMRGSARVGADDEQGGADR